MKIATQLGNSDPPPPKSFTAATHNSSGADTLTYLFSAILVRTATTVGINNYKHGTDLSFCKIHQEKRCTHQRVSWVLISEGNPLGCGLNAQRRESRHQS